MLKTAVFALLFLASPRAFGLDSKLMRLVMPDAKVLAGLNVTSIKASPFGEYLFARNDLLHFGAWRIAAAAGLDPSQDVSEILAATRMADFSRITDLVLVSGTFNVDKIFAVAAQAPDMRISPYGKQRVLSFADPKSGNLSGIAFLGSSIAISGDLDTVKAAIDRSSGGPEAVESDLAPQAKQLSARSDAWIVTARGFRATPVTSKESTSPFEAAFQDVSMSISTRFTNEAQTIVHLTTGDQQKAATITTLIKFFASLGPMLATDPQYAQYADIAQILQAMQVTNTGSDVTVSMPIAEVGMQKLFARIWTGGMSNLLSPVSPPHKADDSKSK